MYEKYKLTLNNIIRVSENGGKWGTYVFDISKMSSRDPYGGIIATPKLQTDSDGRNFVKFKGKIFYLDKLLPVGNEKVIVSDFILSNKPRSRRKLRSRKSRRKSNSRRKQHSRKKSHRSSSLKNYDK